MFIAMLPAETLNERTLRYVIAGRNTFRNLKYYRCEKAR
ncbi:hypothetical protein CSB93_3212 [Pseudomonas paraeruginosa]|uniref:Uncharacterized protein n=1 Tax=Pseudomonas paraeruginosa TaxID=2994495 RepID=A0A2R3ILG0_9PSED|nr:hypothetical protein CSB93_3212 [Pseudomonas paraeruginosa]AWE89830.1 hypothetical protein CSC28_1987 [Pseudomonas paraeruginosa]